MNREIKFRGQPTGKGGIWMVGIGAYKTRTAEHLVLNAKGDCVEVVHLCRYTGLKDKDGKDGKEIYEGDIISFVVFDCFGNDRQYKGVVRWSDFGFVVEVSDDSFDLGWVAAKQDVLKVIGNIHDNPELMKGGSNEA